MDYNVRYTENIILYIFVMYSFVLLICRMEGRMVSPNWHDTSAKRQRYVHAKQELLSRRISNPRAETKACESVVVYIIRSVGDDYFIPGHTLWTRLAILWVSSRCFIKCNEGTIWTFLTGFSHVTYIVRVKSS